MVDKLAAKATPKGASSGMAYQSRKQIWATLAIELVANYLREVVRLELQESSVEDSNDLLMHKFNVTGRIEITHRRRKCNVAHICDLDDEIKWSKEITKKLPSPLTANLHIWAKGPSFNFVSLEFHQMNKPYFNDFIKQRTRDYITVYFKKTLARAEAISGELSRANTNTRPATLPLTVRVEPTSAQIELITKLCQQTNTAEGSGDTDAEFITRLWAQTSVENIPVIFKEIFRFEVIEEDVGRLFPGRSTDRTYSRAFTVNGTLDIVDGRKKKNPNEADFLTAETTFSQNITKKLVNPFKATVHIWADLNDYKFVSIDFHKLNQKNFNFFIETRLKDYISAYGARAIAMAMEISNDLPLV